MYENMLKICLDVLYNKPLNLANSQSVWSHHFKYSAHLLLTEKMLTNNSENGYISNLIYLFD